MKKSFANRMVEKEFEVKDVAAFGLGGNVINGCADGWTGGCTTSQAESGCTTCSMAYSCYDDALKAACAYADFCVDYARSTGK